jgi:hypothetical protein
VIPTRAEQVTIAGVLPSVLSRLFQFSPDFRITRHGRAPVGACRSRELIPTRSADGHLPEARCRRFSILSPAVPATGVLSVFLTPTDYSPLK